MYKKLKDFSQKAIFDEINVHCVELEVFNYIHRNFYQNVTKTWQRQRYLSYESWIVVYSTKFIEQNVQDMTQKKFLKIYSGKNKRKIEFL